VTLQEELDRLRCEHNYLRSEYARLYDLMYKLLGEIDELNHSTKPYRGFLKSSPYHSVAVFGPAGCVLVRRKQRKPKKDKR